MLDLARGLERSPLGAWSLYGLPLALAGWDVGPDRHRLAELARGVRSEPGGGPGRFFGFVVGALAEVSAWSAAGVGIRGRRWVDVGGALGHYALALRVVGAEAVTLLDQTDVPPMIREVLSDAGVSVVVGDAAEVVIPGATAACFLYSTGFDDSFLERHPALQIALEAPPSGAYPPFYDPGDECRLPVSWRRDDLCLRVPVLMSEDYAVPFEEHDHALAVFRASWLGAPRERDGRRRLRARFDLRRLVEAGINLYGAACVSTVGHAARYAGTPNASATFSVGDAYDALGARDETFCVEVACADYPWLQALAQSLLATSDSGKLATSFAAVSFEHEARLLSPSFRVDAGGVHHEPEHDDLASPFADAMGLPLRVVAAVE